MTESKHTPGPWICDVRNGCIAIYDGEQRNCLATDEPTVAYWSGQRVTDADTDTWHYEVDPRDVANARLIAAAPELLAALEFIVATTADGSLDTLTRLKNIRGCATPAIAKAKGEK